MRNLTHKTVSGLVLSILDMKGKDYLPVNQRILWCKTEHGDWSIETDFVLLTDKEAIAKATIKDGSGRVMSTSHKWEAKENFYDFREKAETGAIGRALALCGYGTQFCGDDLDEGERIVDSPIQKKNEWAMKGFNDDLGPAEEGVEIPYGPLAKQLVHKADPVKLRAYIDEIEAKAAKLGKPVPAWAERIIEAATPIIAAFENGTSEAG